MCWGESKAPGSLQGHNTAVASGLGCGLGRLGGQNKKSRYESAPNGIIITVLFKGIEGETSQLP